MMADGSVPVLAPDDLQRQLDAEAVGAAVPDQSASP